MTYERCYCHIFSILKLALTDFVFKLSLFSEGIGHYFVVSIFFPSEKRRVVMLRQLLGSDKTSKSLERVKIKTDKTSISRWNICKNFILGQLSINKLNVEWDYFVLFYTPSKKSRTQQPSPQRALWNPSSKMGLFLEKVKGKFSRVGDAGVQVWKHACHSVNNANSIQRPTASSIAEQQGPMKLKGVPLPYNETQRQHA